ncbi:MAG: metal-sensing transcriptional repressor [Clostridiales bacterium]|jgi:DNA-binding FrmR family transcriptional regulator|nr:metal-sensing transcriptional repressor [Clostridiales bacterium]
MANEKKEKGFHHSHHHDPQEKKRQINRISRIVGHLEHIRKMIENDEDCSDVLVQISAVRSALNGLGKAIINEHITHCITHAIEDGDSSAVDEFKDAIQRYL